jgi:hypothetical protein
MLLRTPCNAGKFKSAGLSKASVAVSKWVTVFGVSVAFMDYFHCAQTKLKARAGTHAYIVVLI